MRRVARRPWLRRMAGARGALRQQCVKSGAPRRMVSFARRILHESSERSDDGATEGAVRPGGVLAEAPGRGALYGPEDLWNAAVDVARVEGVYATSKALRFNYYSLKGRLGLADRAGPSRKRADHPATFVEVQMPAPPSPALRDSAAGGQTVVELVGTGGARMRIDVTGTSRVDVVGLAQAFWSREP